MLANESSVYVIVIKVSGGNSIIYDASNPTRTFEACLETFLAADKKGLIDHKDPNAYQVFTLLDTDCHTAGKMAFHYLQNDPQFTLTFKQRTLPDNGKFHF